MFTVVLERFHFYDYIVHNKIVLSIQSALRQMSSQLMTNRALCHFSRTQSSWHNAWTTYLQTWSYCDTIPWKKYSFFITFDNRRFFKADVFNFDQIAFIESSKPSKILPCWVYTVQVCTVCHWSSWCIRIQVCKKSCWPTFGSDKPSISTTRLLRPAACVVQQGSTASSCLDSIQATWFIKNRNVFATNIR